MTAGDVMDASASLLNDTAKQVYSYAVQLPYLKIALKELREHYELNNMPITNQVSAVLTVGIGVTAVGFNTTPALPSDLIEIEQLWERATGVNPFVPMGKRDFIPHFLEGSDGSAFIIWAWLNNEIRLLASSRINDLKIDYIQKLFTNVVDQNSTVSVESSFLEYRTAALCAQFIGEDTERSGDLNTMAELGKDRSIGIGTKGKQSIPTRHRPFRASYKQR